MELAFAYRLDQPSLVLIILFDNFKGKGGIIAFNILKYSRGIYGTSFIGNLLADGLHVEMIFSDKNKASKCVDDTEQYVFFFHDG